MITSPPTLSLRLPGRRVAYRLLALLLFIAVSLFVTRIERAFVATTWHVSVGSLGMCTVGDPNCATIQAAVNAASAGDTMEIAAGTYAEHDITIGKNLTLTGASAATTIVDAQQLGRVLNVQSGATVEISNLSIVNGKSQDGVNGANCIVHAGPGADGGGILNQGILTLNYCIVSNNRAGKGGNGFNNNCDG